MTFDIYRLDDFDDVSEVIDEYRDELVELFANSPEGQAHAKTYPDMGYWAGSLIYYANQYVGVSIPQMEEGNVEELLTDIFPRKISLSAPEDADPAVPELIAFWAFLKRQFNLHNADGIVSYLFSLKPRDFKTWMNDSSRFGMAKSFFTMGASAGFDMTNQTELDMFMNLYNASLLAGGTGLVGVRSKKDPEKAKRLRKMAKVSRKRNRKRR